MSQPPDRPKIFHITHVENLSSIVASGGLLSHARLTAQGGPKAEIGMKRIKDRRLALPVRCHPGDSVGDFVPFYFCPRSIMLYIFHRGNHRDVTYRGGQDPIVHLESDLRRAVTWAEQGGTRWAFTPSNAGATYAVFRSDLGRLDEIDWEAVSNRDFRPAEVRDAKQAEFLVYGSFPWHLVERIGVCSMSVLQRAQGAIAGAAHRPAVTIERGWYF